MGVKKIELALSSFFCQLFGIALYLIIPMLDFESRNAKMLAKNEEKTWVNLPLKPISPLYFSKNPKHWVKFNRSVTIHILTRFQTIFLIAQKGGELPTQHFGIRAIHK